MDETKRNLAWKWKKEVASPIIKSNWMRRRNAFWISSSISWLFKSQTILLTKREKIARLKKLSCADHLTTSLRVRTVRFQAVNPQSFSIIHLSWKSRDHSGKTAFNNLLRMIWNRIQLSRLGSIILLIPTTVWSMRSSWLVLGLQMVGLGTAFGLDWYVRVS